MNALPDAPVRMCYLTEKAGDPDAIAVAVDFKLSHQLSIQQMRALGWYLDLCIDKGFVTSPAYLVRCAERWMAGKRKVSPPGHQASKRRAAEKRRALLSVPPELLQAISQAIAENPVAVQHFLSGKTKAIGALVGAVLKRYAYDAAAARDLIEKSIQELA